MEIPLKQRLIGAAVLIALAVIFLPMLLDGAGRREQVSMKMEIPPEPQYTFEQPLPSQPEMTTDAQAKLSEQQAGISPQINEQRQSEEPTKPVPSPTHTTQSASKTDTEWRQAKAVQPEKETKTQPKSTPAQDTERWVVQVGSFRKQGNALVLRDKLRAAGYKAFAEKGGDSRKPVFRVKVGPEPERNRAVAMQAKLKSREKLKGIVLKQQ